MDENMDAHFDACDLAADMKDSEWRFAIAPDRTVAALRALADSIERGNMIIQVVRTHQAALVTDFPVRTVVIKYHPKAPPAVQGK